MERSSPAEALTGTAVAYPARSPAAGMGFAGTPEGHASARKRGETVGGAGVTDDHMLSMSSGSEACLADSPGHFRRCVTSESEGVVSA
ncbi:hypothetical protein AB0D04_30395 [Streptomyces sp. NPDC048483]|uniref:hypothetical protein n=1 Tax=Streptomyces sp. NPDC048483 TaxID=3154927 RepID=UPI00341833C1